MMTVYAITNDVNDKVYIGATAQNMNERWGVHKNWAIKGRGYALHRAMREIGIERFSFIRIWSGQITREKLNRLEEYFIKSFRTLSPNGYNETIGGPTRIFKPCSAEKAAKISQSLMGHGVSQTSNEKMAATQFKKGLIPWNKGRNYKLGKRR